MTISGTDPLERYLYRFWSQLGEISLKNVAQGYTWLVPNAIPLMDYVHKTGHMSNIYWFIELTWDPIGTP